MSDDLRPPPFEPAAGPTDPGEHPDELLDAYVDGALTPEERAAVDAHLATCAQCRDEVESIEIVAEALRDLPLVEPPGGFFDVVLRSGPSPRWVRRRRVKVGLANLAVVALVWVALIAVIGFGRSRLQPGTDAYVRRHDGVAAQVLAVRNPGPLPEGLPARIGAYRYAAERDGQYLYTDGRAVVSVFVEPGVIDPEALPEGARPVPRVAEPAYHVDWGDDDVYFIQRGGVVYVVVGPIADAEVPATSGALAAGDEDGSIAARLERAARGLLTTFGLGR